jgi:hypothetical protein
MPTAAWVKCGSVAAMCPACDGWAVKSGSMATGRMRAFVALTVAGAVLLMAGVIMMLVGEAMRLQSPHGWHGIIGLGERAAACGLACGLALLVIVAAIRPGRSRTSDRARPATRSAAANHSRAAGWPGHSDRSVRRGQAERAWDDGREDTDWRHASADDWLGPLRKSTARPAPGPHHRAPQQPLPEFLPIFDYTDDGWLPGGPAAGHTEDRPVERPVGPRGADHSASQATGPQRAYADTPEPWPRGVRSRLDARPSARYQGSPAARYQPSAPPRHRQEPPADRDAEPCRAHTADPAGRTGAIATADTAPLPVILWARSQLDE